MGEFKKNNMKSTNHINTKLFLSFFISLFGVLRVAAYDLPAGEKSDSYLSISVNDISQQGNDLNVDLTIDLTSVKLKENAEVLYTPFIYNGTDTVKLESFAVVGRNRLYYGLRNSSLPPNTFYKGEPITSSFDNNNPSYKSPRSLGETYSCQLKTEYLPWMNNAIFAIDVETFGCASCFKGEQTVPLAQTEYIVKTFSPEFIYITPVAEAVKMREIAARAYIDFAVNRIEINPDYRRNPIELAKIRSTIDSVRNDKDITVRTLHISGTASPEGSYQNNVRLAKGRTESLKNYVQNLYSFPQGFVTTSFEPVDWQGLTQFLRDVTGEDLPHASEILAIVTSDIEPYQRNQKIKTTYPKEYQWLLQNVYPALRHSDYKIEFEIKTYTDISEILEILQTAPQKLSLAELFVAANSQPEGSELYNHAFELAVTMFPEDETANFNAGVNALKRKDMDAAKKYLSKAGNSPEVEYTQAVIELMDGDEDAAYDLFQRLKNSTNPTVATKATEAVEGIVEVREANKLTWHIFNPNP